MSPVYRKTDERIEEVKNFLAKRFQVKDMGELHYFLGVTVAQDQTSGRVWIGQANYTENVLHKHEMENSWSIATPVDTSNKLLKSLKYSGSETLPIGCWKASVFIMLDET